MNRLFAPSIPRTILLSFALSLAISTAISLPALAASDSELKVANGWISLPIFDEDPSAYFVLQSRSKKTRTIVSATSPKSEGVSIRRTAVVDGQWGSAAMPEGMQVPAGGAVAFAPRGLFLRLMSAEPMAVGDSIKIVLEFADGEKLPFEAIVKED